MERERERGKGRRRERSEVRGAREKKHILRKWRKVSNREIMRIEKFNDEVYSKKEKWKSKYRELQMKLREMVREKET